MPRGFHRVTASRRCPVCGKPDWCLIATDGAKAICPREQEGSVIEWGEAGYLHILSGDASRDAATKFRSECPSEPDGPAIDAEHLSAVYQAAMTFDQCKHEAGLLGVSMTALTSLGIGWSKDKLACAFPMRDAGRKIIGIRLRNSEGRKWAVKGSRSGLFIPGGEIGTGPLLVCEGPTDTAAAIDLGFDVIGRPACRGSVGMVRQYIATRKRETVIVSDVDGPGVKGAKDLANAIVDVAYGVKVIMPTGGNKDLRAWLVGGAKHNTVRNLIDNTARVPVRRV